MSAQSCPRFASCSAPLCPMDEGSLRHAAWMPGEPICTARREPWVLRQRKITRKLDPEAGFFNAPMLQHECRVTKGLCGFDGERVITAEMVQDWKRRHPAMTAEDRARQTARLPHGCRFQRAPAVPEGRIVPHTETFVTEDVSVEGGGR